MFDCEIFLAVPFVLPVSGADIDRGGDDRPVYVASKLSRVSALPIVTNLKSDAVFSFSSRLRRCSLILRVLVCTLGLFNKNVPQSLICFDFFNFC